MATDQISQNLYLTSEETAELLKISRRTLERMRLTGDGPPFMKIGSGKRSRVLYKQSHITEWLENRIYRSTSEYNI